MDEVIFRVTRSIKKVEDKKRLCWHNSVEVDEHTRTIHCSDCDAVIDAFEYVLKWANDQRRHEMEVTYKQRELKSLVEEIEALKKERAYIKRKPVITKCVAIDSSLPPQ